MTMGKCFRIYEKLKPPSPHSIIMEHRNCNQTLLFESQVVAVLREHETESLKSQYVKLLDAYGCLGVLQFNYGDSSFLYLVMVTGCFSVGKIYDSEIFRITQTHFIALHYSQSNNEDRISEIKKVLNSGTFYFSWSAGTQHVLDLTLSVQQRYSLNTTDNRFFWNRMLHIHLQRFGVDTDNWLLKAICGSIEIRTVYVGHRQARAVIVSRLSCERAGTRFNVRGSNDDGHVANFVETEQIIYLDNEVSSFIQTRGSVPLFWEQPGVQVGSHKIKISRGFEASSPAFNRHFNLVKKRYGQQVIVNLLGTSLIGSKEGEALLSQLYQSHQASSRHHDIPHIIFDYHQECRGGNTKSLQKLKEKIESYLQDYSFFHAVGDEIMQSQVGTVRTNCLDCLDRTNCVQTFIALEMLREQLAVFKVIDKQQVVSRFDEVFRQMWVNNGNEISKIYAGTGAIQGSSKLMDGARSAARTIQNNLLDSNKQEAMDVLLFGSPLNTELADRARTLLSSNMLHAPSNVLREMCKRYKEFVDRKPLRVACATYNVNGGKHFRSVVYKDVSLTDWLLDAPKSSASLEEQINGSDPVDVFAVGFEEIVDLNASNIMAASSENAKAWAEELQKVLSRDNEYVLVTYHQLVGVCLYVFIKSTLVDNLRDVAVDSVKTGLGGATGNKGAVAIRFVLNSTSFCFVCAHFAAGQSQVHERNADYAEITRKIVFPMGRTLNAHDYVFWCGDFNYRVDMDKDEMKEMIKRNELDEILKFDQLKVQQDQGNVFKNYSEGPINFAPTYKYDLFSDDYDTSEKCRQPAWTDRVLWKRRKLHDVEIDHDWNPGNIVFYGRAELKQSDHRPVIAIIDVDYCCINEDRRNKVFREVVGDLGPPDGTIILHPEDSSDDVDNIYDDNFMTTLVQDLSELGEVLLVRFVDDRVCITFRNGQSAMSAAQKGTINIYGQSLAITLKTPDWVSCVEREIQALGDSRSDASCPVRRVEAIPSHPTRPPPPPRPTPPARPPQPMTPKREVVATYNTSADDNSSEADFAIYEEIPETPVRTNAPRPPSAVPPPLPPRQGPLPPPRNPPPPPPPNAQILRVTVTFTPIVDELRYKICRTRASKKKIIKIRRLKITVARDNYRGHFYLDRRCQCSFIFEPTNVFIAI
uniref:phosphoinositide 5-phosphatase n=2 Tax=Trichogramma kaykai TaxID=54128 RepID=A0ABD2WZA8_9HYME